jgi:hypothetical protein
MGAAGFQPASNALSLGPPASRWHICFDSLHVMIFAMLSLLRNHVR